MRLAPSDVLAETLACPTLRPPRDGDGTFATVGSQVVGPEASEITVSDFNGDGDVDLAICAYGLVAILMGRGDGTFGGAPPIHQLYCFTVAGDFNGDGRTDLMTGHRGEKGLSGGGVVYLGNGDGTFQSTVPFYDSMASIGYVPMWAEDFDCDGRLDVVANDGIVAVLLNSGCTPEPLDGGHRD